MRAPRIPAIAHLAEGTRGSQKATCPNCKGAVIIVVVDGQRATLDTELVTIATDNPRDRSERIWVTGRRPHAVSCEQRRRDTEKAKLRREMQEWKRGQRTRGM